MKKSVQGDANRAGRRKLARFVKRSDTLQRNGHAEDGIGYAAHFTRQNGGAAGCPGCRNRRAS